MVACRSCTGRPEAAARTGRDARTGRGPEPKDPSKPSTTPVGNLDRGVATLMVRYETRAGSMKVPGAAHTESSEDGNEVKLGVLVSDSKSRRGRLSGRVYPALRSMPYPSGPGVPCPRPRRIAISTGE